MSYVHDRNAKVKIQEKLIVFSIFPTESNKLSHMILVENII